MEEKFDYNEAIAELERIAARVEDPATGLDEIDRCIKRSDELIGRCREYLRSARTKTDEL
ncbi:MAG: exodeoxyribonuclease VII small subunit [Bacteroidales bacterium]|jgi:exodeoxyribonuclease VII small subunit|nr:exodeoxyribonuclease VII small subunit [Bacteroidales bacterium]